MLNDATTAGMDGPAAAAPAGWRPRTWGLSARLYALVLLAALPAVAFLALSELGLRRDLAQRARDEALRSARQIAQELDRTIEGARAVMAAVAQTPGVRELSETICPEFLTALGRESPQLTGFSVIDPNGIAVCAARPERTATSVADRDYFRRAMAGERFVLGARIVGRVSGEPVLPLAHRLEGASGAPAGVLVSGLRLERQREQLAGAGFPAGTSVTVFDRGGTVLVRLPDAEAEGGPLPGALGRLAGAGRGGVLRLGAAESGDGIARIVAHASPAESPHGLGVAVGLPQAWAFAGVQERTWRGAALVGLGAALACLAALLFSRALVLRPVTSLLGAAERLRAGDTAARAGPLPAPSTELGRLGAAFDRMAAEIERRERDLATERERLRLILDNLSEAVVAAFPGEPHPVRNRSWFRLHRVPGPDALPGPRVEDLVPLFELRDGDGRRLPVEEYPINRVMRGEALDGLELGVRRADTGEAWWASFNGSCLRDADGGLALALLSIRDVTARREAEEQRGVLLAELSHRVKNTLAVVQALASHTAARAPDVPAFVAAFRGRLRALAAAHDLLTATGWRGASLRGLAERTLATYREGAGPERVALDVAGDLQVPAAAAQSLALVLNELATNAAKYGALSAPGGGVSLSARAEGDGEARRLLLAWAESGGPPVAEPAGRGFGTTLITQVVAHQHGGRAAFDWRPEGLACAIELPLGGAAEGG